MSDSKNSESESVTAKPKSASEQMSDPCQIPIKDPVTGKRDICGVIMKSLQPHLKFHNRPGMIDKQKWTRKRYEKEFPGFSLGVPHNVPTPENFAKFVAGRNKQHQAVAENKNDTSTPAAPIVTPAPDQLEDWITKRKNELWDQVNRDTAAETFAEEAARAEYRIKEINKRYDRAFAMNHHEKLKALTRELIEMQAILKSQMDFLDMNVKSRRAQGGLGNDTVAQLVSNYGGTLRRWSPERMETFKNRINEVRRVQAERLRTRLLGEILEETITDPVEQEEVDYDGKLQEIIDKANK